MFFVWLAGFFPNILKAQTFRSPEKVFRPQAKVLDPNHLEVRFDIEKGHYLYKEKLKFKIEPAGVKIAEVTLPNGELKEDPVFGRMEIYHEALRIPLPLIRNNLDLREIFLEVAYQGCSENGLCYPPQKYKVSLTLPPLGQETVSAAPGPGPPSSPPTEKGLDESTRISRWLDQQNVFWTLLGFFGFGLLLSLTPCVFPMIPILSSIIVAQGETISKKQGLALSSCYVLGMALTYAVAGVVAGLSGSMLAVYLQNPWVLGAFALVFVLLALSMFGFYELRMPCRLESRLCLISNRFSGGSSLGVFIMGALSALIVGPCVSAPLAGALLYISRTQNVWLGGSALFILAVGMGVPLLVIGTSAGVLLPKAGHWMEAVKKCFGILLLGMALYLISPFTPIPVQMLLWGILLITVSIFLCPLDPLPPDSSGWKRVGKGIGVVILLIGVAYLVGALSGADDFYRPLSGFFGKQASPIKEQPKGDKLSFQPVTGAAELDRLLQSSPDRLTMLYFGAEWCASCNVMERTTFRDPQVREKLAGYRLLKVDLTDNSPEGQALLKKFNLFGPPAMLLFDRQGREIAQARMIGEQTAPAFLKGLEKISQP